MVILLIFDHFGSPGTKILGNQLSEGSESATNELRGYENRVVGTKISILALLVWKIWSFYSFWTILIFFLVKVVEKIGTALFLLIQP